jgi:DDE superfamily endonuclease
MLVLSQINWKGVRRMIHLPREAALLQRMCQTFTKPTGQRFLFLAVAAIIAMGRRTVSHILWSACCLCQGDPSSYHRFFSKARWSLWPLARILAAAVLELVPADQAVVVDADDTVAEHRGERVFGTGCHRDAVRSSWAHTAFKWGHKWVVLAVNVRLPWCRRDWALPVMAALYTPRPEDQAPGGKRHKTPALLARQMMAALMHWFPDRKFILLGDWGFASHDLALFCHRHADRVTLIARLRSDANLHALPPAKQQRRGVGRKKRKGRKLPGPRQAVAQAQCRARASVRWYGSSVRELEMLSGCGGWYRGRGGGRAALIPIRWVFTHDPQEDHDDYFYSTDPTQSPVQIIESFAGRWNMEVSFEEIRAHLSFESTRMRCENSVKRAGALLLGLFGIVSLIYARIAHEKKVKVYGTPCYHKTNPTFADALAAVRKMLWQKVILQHVPGGPLVAKLPLPAWQMLLDHLAAAA